MNLFDKYLKVDSRSSWLATAVLVSRKYISEQSACFGWLTVTNTCLPIVSTSDSLPTRKSWWKRWRKWRHAQVLFVANTLSTLPANFFCAVHTHKLKVSLPFEGRFRVLWENCSLVIIYAWVPNVPRKNVFNHNMSLPLPKLFTSGRCGLLRLARC